MGAHNEKIVMSNGRNENYKALSLKRMVQDDEIDSVKWERENDNVFPTKRMTQDNETIPAKWADSDDKGTTLRACHAQLAQITVVAAQVLQTFGF